MCTFSLWIPWFLPSLPQFTNYSEFLVSYFQGFARQLSKTELRRPTIEKLIRKKEEDIGYFRDYITKDAIQKSLGMYLESLKNKKK